MLDFTFGSVQSQRTLYDMDLKMAVLKPCVKTKIRI